MEKPEKSASQPPKTTYASVRRQRFIGLGSEAAVVGFFWVGYVVGGAVLGYFLDAHFHTSFLTPALLLFGAVEGFREMMVTVSRLNKNAKAGSGSGGTASANRPVKEYKEYPADDEAPETVEPTPPQRIFQVPAPPQPSFVPSPKDVKASAASLTRSVSQQSQASEPEATDEDASTEKLIQELLNERPNSSQ